MEKKKICKKKSESNENSSNLFLGKKTSHSSNEINKEIKINSNIINNRGKWAEDEQNKFSEGIALYGTNWKKVQYLIKTRSFTLNSICNIKDIILQIESTNKNYNISNVLKYLYNKYIISTKNKKVPLNKNFSETCKISEANIYSNRQGNNNLNNDDKSKKTIIFNNLNIINNNIRVNPSKEFIIFQYWLIVLYINQQINNLLMSIIINNLLLSNSTFLNKFDNDEHNYNNNHLILYLLLFIYIYQMSNDRNNISINQRN